MNLMLPLLLAVAQTLTTNEVAASAHVASNGSTRVTAGSTYYDRKEGFVYFSGKVAVEDPRYQMHADRAYVFMSGTNDLKRIVALGQVAITNETKRAYGAKASYYRDTGMVVLYSGDGRVAEVRDETPEGDRIVRGKKIRFWTGTRQVEVLEAVFDVPSQGGLGDLKDALKR